MAKSKPTRKQTRERGIFLTVILPYVVVPIVVSLIALAPLAAGLVKRKPNEDPAPLTVATSETRTQQGNTFMTLTGKTRLRPNDKARIAAIAKLEGGGANGTVIVSGTAPANIDEDGSYVLRFLVPTDVDRSSIRVAIVVPLEYFTSCYSEGSCVDLSSRAGLPASGAGLPLVVDRHKPEFGHLLVVTDRPLPD